MFVIRKLKVTGSSFVVALAGAGRVKFCRWFLPCSTPIISPGACKKSQTRALFSCFADDKIETRGYFTQEQSQDLNPGFPACVISLPPRLSSQFPTLRVFLQAATRTPINLKPSDTQLSHINIPDSLH